MQVTITLDWGNATDDQKKGWLIFVSLPDEFIYKIFKDLDAEQLSLCIEHQTLGTDLIRKLWNGLTEGIRTRLLTYQNLLPELVDDIWNDATQTVRLWIVHTQQLSLKQPFAKWAELTTKQRAAVFGFGWDDTPNYSPEVSEFLIVMDRLWEEVGTDAVACLNALPELLTHSNELVRAIAAGYMDGHIGSGKATNSRGSPPRN